MIENALTSGSLYYNAAKNEYFVGLHYRFDLKYAHLSESTKSRVMSSLDIDGNEITVSSALNNYPKLYFFPLKMVNSAAASPILVFVKPTSYADVGIDHPGEGDKLFRFKTAKGSGKTYFNSDNTAMKMDMNDYEKYEYHKAEYVHKAHASLEEGFYKDFPTTGHGQPDIAPADIQTGDVISDGLKKYVKLDAIAHQDAVTFRAKG